MNFFAVDNPDLFVCELKSSEGLSYHSFHASLVELTIAILRAKESGMRAKAVGEILIGTTSTNEVARPVMKN